MLLNKFQFISPGVIWTRFVVWPYTKAVLNSRQNYGPPAPPATLRIADAGKSDVQCWKIPLGHFCPYPVNTDKPRKIVSRND